MENDQPTRESLAGMVISDVLERWPATADVFQTHAMACVGCAVAPFYTIQDAVEVYGLTPDDFITDLMAAIRATNPEQVDQT